MRRKRFFSSLGALRIGSFFCVVFFTALSCRGIFGPDGSQTGICSRHKDSPFVLPYPVGQTFLCIQGYTGPNHHPELMKYAVDFAMPIGSIVVAARDGRVIFVEQSFEDGDFGQGRDNVIVLQHEDGTYSRYVHLTKNGALVSLQQPVSQGEPIGLSGNTGQSLSPHLHFDVTRGDGTRNAQTIPVCFKNTRAHPHGLETGAYYTAEPY
jgi:murein DD-endopeptidase MepM/ murein hydrolase activator NlpD